MDRALSNRWITIIRLSNNLWQSKLSKVKAKASSSPPSPECRTWLA